MSKSKGMVARSLRKEAAKQEALASLWVIPPTREEHLSKAHSLREQAKALFS